MTTAGWPDSNTMAVTSDSHSYSVGFHSHVNNCLFAVKQNEQRLFEDCLNSSRFVQSFHIHVDFPMFFF